MHKIKAKIRLTEKNLSGGFWVYTRGNEQSPGLHKTLTTAAIVNGEATSQKGGESNQSVMSH